MGLPITNWSDQERASRKASLDSLESGSSGSQPEYAGPIALQVGTDDKRALGVITITDDEIVMTGQKGLFRPKVSTYRVPRSTVLSLKWMEADNGSRYLVIKTGGATSQSFDVMWTSKAPQPPEELKHRLARWTIA